jgi:AraC family transcriptional regulator
VQNDPDKAYNSIDAASIVHCRLPAWSANDYVSSSAVSSIGLSFTQQTCVVETGGRTIERTVSAASAVVVGQEPIDWLRVDQPSELMEVSATAPLRHELAEELRADAHADLADLAFADDPIVWAVAARLRILVRRDDPADALEVDWLVRRLYGHVLVTRFGGRLREKADGALDRRRLARVADYVETHLGESLSLDVLASVAALSVFHFHRSFRRATGCSPHHYVALRRAEQANRCLANGGSIRTAALTLGYRDARALLRAVQMLAGTKRLNRSDFKP